MTITPFLWYNISMGFPKKKKKVESEILKSMREMREGTHPGVLEKEKEFKKLRSKYGIKENRE